MTNSTLLNLHKGWEGEPDGRGTMSLVWSCLSVIFICSWSALHPQIPPSNYSTTRIFIRKIGMMCFCLVVPELLVLDASQCWFDCRLLSKKMATVPQGDHKWTRAHSWFTSMGGIAVRDRNGRTHICDTGEFWTLVESGMINVPNLSKAEIEEKSKGDGLSKAIACIQIIYVVAQLIGRAIQQLPTSTLELFTLAMIAMALCLYGFWWHKPLDVRFPMIVDLKKNDNASNEKISGWIQHRKNESSMWFDMYAAGFAKSNYGDIFCSAGATIVFGVCHLIGWDFEFPTETEQLLWRIASCACATIPLISLALAVLLDRGWAREIPCIIVLLVCVACYILVRLYLVVEVFVGLRQVPAGVYQTVEWSQFFPHI